MQNIDGITGKARTEWLVKAGCWLVEVVSDKLFTAEVLLVRGVQIKDSSFLW